MEENNSLKCPSCGADVVEGKAFCPECGIAMNGENTEKEQNAFEEPSVDALILNEELETETPAENAVPPEEDKKESRKERRQREKAEAKAQKEAEKLRKKEEKKAAKEEARRIRRENFRKRNIWAIILMIVFFAGLCYMGYEYLGARKEIKSLHTENTELSENIEALKNTIGENEETIAAKDSELAEQKEKQAELEGEMGTRDEELESIKGQLKESKEDLKEAWDEYDELLGALKTESLGYASRRLYADGPVVIVEKNKNAEFNVYANEIESAVCSDEALTIVAEDTEDDCTVFTVGAKKAGVYIVTVTGGKNSEVINIIVIQK